MPKISILAQCNICEFVGFFEPKLPHCTCDVPDIHDKHTIVLCTICAGNGKIARTSKGGIFEKFLSLPGRMGPVTITEGKSKFYMIIDNNGEGKCPKCMGAGRSVDRHDYICKKCTMPRLSNELCSACAGSKWKSQTVWMPDSIAEAREVVDEICNGYFEMSASEKTDAVNIARHVLMAFYNAPKRMIGVFPEDFELFAQNTEPFNRLLCRKCMVISKHDALPYCDICLGTLVVKTNRMVK